MLTPLERTWVFSCLWEESSEYLGMTNTDGGRNWQDVPRSHFPISRHWGECTGQCPLQVDCSLSTSSGQWSIAGGEGCFCWALVLSSFMWPQAISSFLLPLWPMSFKVGTMGKKTRCVRNHTGGERMASPCTSDCDVP